MELDHCADSIRFLLPAACLFEGTVLADQPFNATLADAVVLGELPLGRTRIEVSHELAPKRQRRLLGKTRHAASRSCGLGPVSRPDPASHLWYYESLADCYRGHVPDGLAGELDRVLADMRTLADPPEARVLTVG